VAAAPGGAAASLGWQGTTPGFALQTLTLGLPQALHLFAATTVSSQKH